jgi:hypothetical protein
MLSPARKKNIALLNLRSIKPTTDETVKQQIISISPVNVFLFHMIGKQNFPFLLMRKKYFD